MTVLNNDFFRFRYHKGKINATNKNPTKNDTIRGQKVTPILDQRWSQIKKWYEATKQTFNKLERTWYSIKIDPKVWLNITTLEYRPEMIHNRKLSQRVMDHKYLRK